MVVFGVVSLGADLVCAKTDQTFGDLDIAEEATAGALATAVERWPADGVPQTPAPG